jgi:hypothetical protein
MDEVSAKLDKLVNDVIFDEGGEPWLSTTDEIKKTAIKPNLMDPKSWVYVGLREVVFAGPSKFDIPDMRDGFKPQSDREDFSF